MIGLIIIGIGLSAIVGLSAAYILRDPTYYYVGEKKIEVTQESYLMAKQGEYKYLYAKEYSLDFESGVLYGGMTLGVVLLFVGFYSFWSYKK